MKTMYRAEQEIFTDMECRRTAWEALTDYTTKEEAMEATKKVVKTCGYDTGTWRVVARTIDENTFTFTDEVIAKFDWYEEVGRKQYAREEIERCVERIAKLTLGLERVRTEKGYARKMKEIKENEENIKEMKKWLAGE